MKVFLVIYFMIGSGVWRTDSYEMPSMDECIKATTSAHSSTSAGDDVSGWAAVCVYSDRAP